MNTKPSSNGLKQDEFYPFVIEYENNLHRFGLDSKIGNLRSINISFVPNMPRGEIGMCYYFTDSIEVNKDYWDRANINERDELIVHELGHCVLGLNHSAPTSIMQAVGVLSNYYKINYSYLTNRYFGCKTGDCISLAWDEQRYTK